MKRADLDRQHFDGIAERYTGKDLVRSSRCARRLRLEHVVGRVPLDPTWRVLEVGCGAGFAATYLRGRYGSYTGIDHSHELITSAERLNAGPNIKFLRSGVVDFNDDSGFDLVFLIGVLHHMDGRRDIMSQLRDLVRPGGYLAVNEPQPSNPIVSGARKLRAILDSSYSDDQDEIACNELLRLFSAAELTEIEISPQGVFSTPFAEVPMRPDWLMTPIARAACLADTLVEPRLTGALRSVTWNLTAIGRRQGTVPSDNPVGEVDPS